MSHEDRSDWTIGPLGNYGPPSRIVELPARAHAVAAPRPPTAEDGVAEAEIEAMVAAALPAARERVGADAGSRTAYAAQDAGEAQRAKDAALGSLAVGTVLTPAERARLAPQQDATEAVPPRRAMQVPPSPLERARAQEYAQAHQRTVQQAQDAGDDAAYASLRSAGWLTWEERQRIEQRHQAQLAARQTRGTIGRAG